MRESASSNTHPSKDWSTGKRHKRYVDLSKSASKYCMVHGPGHSSDEYKVWSVVIDSPTTGTQLIVGVLVTTQNTK